MALKLVCDVCGKEVFVDDSGGEPRAYAICVCTTVHGWLTIWSPKYELPGFKESKKLRAISPLSGDRVVCSATCAEKALGELNREQLRIVLGG